MTCERLRQEVVQLREKNRRLNEEKINDQKKLDRCEKLLAQQQEVMQQILFRISAQETTNIREKEPVKLFSGTNAPVSFQRLYDPRPISPINPQHASFEPLENNFRMCPWTLENPGSHVTQPIIVDDTPQKKNVDKPTKKRGRKKQKTTLTFLC